MHKIIFSTIEEKKSVEEEEATHLHQQKTSFHEAAGK